MEVLYKLLCRKRFWTAYHYIGPIFECLEEANFKFLCVKTRMVPHVVNVCSKAVFGLFLCHALSCSVRHSIPTHHSSFLAFVQEFFNNMYCCTDLCCYANFSIVSDKTLAGQKSLRLGGGG